MSNKILLFLCCCVFSICSMHAQCRKKSNEQKESFNLGVVEHIKSTVLDEKRILNIYLPEGYDTSLQTKYPVIYLLDGSANEDFIHVVGVVQFLSMMAMMPQSILVGIVNVDRKRDFTFPTTIAQDKIDFPSTGGSEKFISFLENEVLPFVKNKYRVSQSMLIGQSLGGLLATEIVLKKPALFSKYLIVSPSLWWDNESLLNSAQELIAQNLHTKITVIISAGEKEDEQMQKDAKTLATVLQNNLMRNNNLITCRYHNMPEEDHATILHHCVYDAMLLFEEMK